MPRFQSRGHAPLRKTRKWRERSFLGVGIAGAVSLIFMALAPFGCSTTKQTREDVWVQIIPGRRYTFQDVSGEVRDNVLVIRGTMRAVGYFEPEFASMIIEGRDKGNKVQVSERATVRMQGRTERFVVRLPYRPDLDWTVESYEGAGLLNKLKSGF